MASAGPPVALSTEPVGYGPPPSNQDGVFPRSLLEPGERVVYETRSGYLRRYWGRTVLGLGWALLWVAAVPSLPTNPIVYLFVLSGLLPVALAYRRWRVEAYAFTDRRVVALRPIVSGKGGFSELPLGEIASVELGAGMLRFLAQASAPGPPSVPGGPGAGVVWDYLPDPVTTQAFLEGELRRRVAPAGAPAAVGGPTESPIVCPNCGDRTYPSRLDRARPACPQCRYAFPKFG